LPARSESRSRRHRWLERLRSTAARADYQVTESTRGFVKANLSKIHLSQGTALAVDELEIIDASPACSIR